MGVEGRETRSRPGASSAARGEDTFSLFKNACVEMYMLGGRGGKRCVNVFHV
jgi:hypothetical protein